MCLASSFCSKGDTARHHDIHKKLASQQLRQQAFAFKHFNALANQLRGPPVREARIHSSGKLPSGSLACCQREAHGCNVFGGGSGADTVAGVSGDCWQWHRTASHNAVIASRAQLQMTTHSVPLMTHRCTHPRWLVTGRDRSWAHYVCARLAFP